MHDLPAGIEAPWGASAQLVGGLKEKMTNILAEASEVRNCAALMGNVGFARKTKLQRQLGWDAVCPTRSGIWEPCVEVGYMWSRVASSGNAAVHIKDRTYRGYSIRFQSQDGIVLMQLGFFAVSALFVQA